jgi:hypothetical protein
MSKFKVHGTLALTLTLLALAAGPLLADNGPQHQAVQSLPIKLGTSGGSSVDASNAFCCGGTFGSAVTYDGQLAILSNNHILARSGSATAGEDDIQPGLIDVGCRASGAHVVADFVGNVVPLGSGLGGHNVDTGVAIARSGAVSTTGEILDVGVPCNTTQAASIGLAVMKSGRTTGFTTGNIQATNVSVSIQYQKGCNSGKKFTITYTNQISTGAMSAGGDSGSLLVSNDGSPNPVGLLYAGSSSTTIYNPIGDVLGAYAAAGHTVAFVGNTCAASRIALNPGIGPADNDVEYARVIKERYEPDLFSRPGVIGVGVGATVDGGTEAAIILYVDAPKGSHPQGFPAELDGVKVRVIPTDPIVAQ